MAITFLDDSKVSLTEHSQLLIDEYIYDPDPSKSKMALTFGLGTARFITGNLNRIDKQNISLKTPTANIAIRGTDFTATVDELGRSLIILLPDALGLSSGEIEVVTAMGSVILNKPYEATTVSVFESTPSKPVILDLTLDVIDNMLIVTPPKEEIVIQEETTTKKGDSVLDFNDLDIDYLAEDFLSDDSLEYNELSINYLDVNYLEDLLTAVFVCHTKILTTVRVTNKDRKINLKIPSVENFLHQVYIEMARAFWKHPYLLNPMDVSKLEYQENLRKSESMIYECLETTIRKLLPVKDILKEYLNVDGPSTEMVGGGDGEGEVGSEACGGGVGGSGWGK